MKSPADTVRPVLHVAPFTPETLAQAAQASSGREPAEPVVTLFVGPEAPAAPDPRLMCGGCSRRSPKGVCTSGASAHYRETRADRDPACSWFREFDLTLNAPAEAPWSPADSFFLEPYAPPQAENFVTTHVWPAAPAVAPAAPDSTRIQYGAPIPLTRAELYALANNALVVPFCADGATPAETRRIREAGALLAAILRELQARDAALDDVRDALRLEAVAADPEAAGYARGLARALSVLAGSR